MFARVTVAHTRPGKSDEVLRIHRESVVPACKGQKGFKGLYLLHDAKGAKGLTISLWDTEADMAAAEASGFYQEQVAKFRDLFSSAPVKETYEVSIQP